jgi:uncharacterized protein
MPQYLAPGVYVEEIPSPQTIEGVSTSTAGFVGPTRMGPISGTPPLLTSLADFIAIYGSLDQLTFDGGSGIPTTNFMAQSVREFFDNDGGLLYVSRIYDFGPNTPSLLFPGGPSVPYGYASAQQPPPGSPPAAETITWTGRYPGAGANVALTITLSVTPNVLTQVQSGANPPANTLRGTLPYDIVWIANSLAGSPPSGGELYWAESYLNQTTGQASWRFHSVTDVAAGSGTDISALPFPTQIFVLRAGMQITYHLETSPRTDVYTGITFDPRSSQSFVGQFGPNLPNGDQQARVPVVFSFSNSTVASGIQIAEIMLQQSGVSVPGLIGGTPAQLTVVLTGGLDGFQPTASDYQGAEDPNNPQSKTGLKALEDVAQVAIVAAPGSTYGAGSDPSQTSYQNALQTQYNVITHCEQQNYRSAILDAPNNYSVSQISAWRGQIDSSYAALYYPWVQVLDPVSDTEILLPPSGFVAGIYARNDQEVGPHKAPANEVVTDALGFEVMLNKGQQEVLNPLGVNCFRYFVGRGYLLWGARMATTDTDFTYVNLRRYTNYLKFSIDLGTQYVVFENNGPDLWRATKQLVYDFLYDEFLNGRLFGTTPEQAFFVRCDQTTMSQNDIANGRLVCMIGVALLRPAEFVIFRIGQFTATSNTGG